MSEKETPPEWVGKSFTSDRTTIRSFTGDASEPTTLPAETPYSIGGDNMGPGDSSVGVSPASDEHGPPNDGGAGDDTD